MSDESLPRRVVLIVEDEAGIREGLVSLLADEGYQIATAQDGSEALLYLRGHPAPALILLDLMLPGTSGWEFRSAQLADPALAAIPVVLLSGVSSVHQQAGLLRADGFLAKPFEVDLLLEVVKAYAGRGR